jgi:hypothetical protein
MKRIMLAAAMIALVCIANTSNAQSKDKDIMYSRPEFGIKGGVSLTGISNLKGNERTTGHVGIFVHHTINKNWCFQPELLYSAQGQHFKANDGQSRVLALDYIQAPFMMQYYPAKRFYVELGPQVGVLVNSQTKDINSGNNKNDVGADYRKADLGLNAGLGVSITNHVGIYGRYTQGFIDVTKSTDTYRLNSGVQLGASIRF